MHLYMLIYILLIYIYLPLYLKYIFTAIYTFIYLYIYYGIYAMPKINLYIYLYLFTYIHDFMPLLIIINILFIITNWFDDFYTNYKLGSNGTGKWYTLQNMLELNKMWFADPKS